MKLLSISLTNVRRFAGTTVCLDGLGGGLNLVAAPNEAGKSTFFEALEALLFLASATPSSARSSRTCSRHAAILVGPEYGTLQRRRRRRARPASTCL